MPKSVFEQIKKQNGERFAKTIRGYDNGIFDIPGIVDIVKYAGREAEPIMEYLESLKEIHIEETGVYQDPLTLLDEAGYDAYYVTNLEEQNAIQKYYAEGEKLCTFRDPHRFEHYYIINAVRKDVDQIKREDFRGKEKREDEYGTSVLSIQILKNGGFISIKNRYNHTVQNPDNTLGSNPDNIIPGLANAIHHHFNVDFSTRQVHLPDGYVFINNQIIRYNYEQDNIYFGSNFYVKDGIVHKLESHKLILDSYIFDMRTKTLEYPIPEENSDADKAFKKVFLKEIEGRSVIIKKEKNEQHLFIHKEGEKDPTKDIEILTLKDGIITSLNLPTTTEIGKNFLVGNRRLISFNAPNLISTGKFFLSTDEDLREINVPKLQFVGDYFLDNSKQLTSFNAPSLQYVGDNFIHTNQILSEFSAPELKAVGDMFLYNCEKLRRLSLPELKSTGLCFLRRNTDLEFFEAPKLEVLCHNSLEDNKALKTLHLPALVIMESNVLKANNVISHFSAPSLQTVGYSSLSGKSLETLDTPALEKIGDFFLSDNTALTHLYLPKVVSIGDYFLSKHIGLDNIDLPSLQTVGERFMRHSILITSFKAPKLEHVGESFLGYNEGLKTFYAPLLEDIPGYSSFKTITNYNFLWEHRKDEPKVGISETLQQAEAEKQEPVTPAPEPEPQKGISARLTQAEKEKTDNPSFFKKLRDWLLPQK